LISMFIMVIMKAESQAMSITSTVTDTGMPFVYPGISIIPRIVIILWPAINGITCNILPCEEDPMVSPDRMVSSL